MRQPCFSWCLPPRRLLPRATIVTTITVNTTTTTAQHRLRSRAKCPDKVGRFAQILPGFNRSFSESSTFVQGLTDTTGRFEKNVLLYPVPFARTKEFFALNTPQKFGTKELYRHMKRMISAAVLMMAMTGTALAHAKHYHPPKPLHKNAPHPYTKHEAAKHPKAIHPHK